MYNYITFNYGGIIVRGIALAEFTLTENWPLVKKKKVLFFNFNKIVSKVTINDWILVYIPWKHLLKELVLINKKDVISKEYNKDLKWISIDKFESEYNCESPYISIHQIENFKGYDFIYNHKSFLANIINKDYSETYDILYKNIPSILNEEFDEDKAKRDSNIFLTYDQKRKGTGFIELQIADNISRDDALKKKIRHFNKTSLYIEGDSNSLFVNQYLKIFTKVNKNIISIFDFDYFNVEDLKEIKKQLLLSKPIDYEILLKFVDSCIINNKSIYYLGI